MVSTGAKVLSSVFPLGARAWQSREARKAIGEVVPEALAEAICPSDPKDPAAREAAKIIHGRLRHTEIASVEGRPPSWIRRQWETLRGRVGSERAPRVAAFGETEFNYLLWRWITEALRRPDDELNQALGRIRCREAELHAEASPEVIAVYFPGAFLRVLDRSKGSKWRTELLESLRIAERNRGQRKKLIGWTELMFASAGAGGTTALAVHLADASTTEELIAGLTAAGIVIPTQLGVAWRRRVNEERDPLRQTVRDRVRIWLEDARDTLTDTSAKDIVLPSSVWLGQVRGNGHAPDEMRVLDAPHGLIDHLSHLQSDAAGGGQQDLATALFELKHALARARYNPTARGEAADALQRVVELTCAD